MPIKFIVTKNLKSMRIVFHKTTECTTNKAIFQRKLQTTYMRCGGEGDSETTGNIVISILSGNLSLDAIVAVAAYSTMGD